jgi:hypothetical protein
MYLGLTAERRYFFADENHPQNIYYQTILSNYIIKRLVELKRFNPPSEEGELIGVYCKSDKSAILINKA